jgi:3-demethoxyubiquinol 3-hydroxylase
MTNTLISTLDSALRTLFAQPHAARAYPTSPVTFNTSGQADALSAADKALSGALMRVNHVGEVCAQALYAGQALATDNAAYKDHLTMTSKEEGDHLAWTAQRLQELGARPSLLNPLWYAGAFGMGLLAGKMGDAMSRAFVVETERQVEAHLGEHLARLPAADHASKAVVAQMQADEARHAAQASAGAAQIPEPVRLLMAAAAKVMTTVAHRV